MAHHLQPHNRNDEGRNEKKPPEGDRLMEEEYADKHRTHRTYASPDGIGRAYRYGLHRLRKQYHAERKAQKKARTPKIIFNSGQPLHLSEAEGKAGLTESGQNENQPVHVHFVKTGGKDKTA